MATDGSEYQLASGSLSWMAENGNEWQLALGPLSWMAANGSEWQRVATRTGLAEPDGIRGSDGQREANRSGLLSVDGTRMASRIEPAQVGMDASGSSQWACSARI